MRRFVLNLSLIRQPCVCVAHTVVSDMNERLSPKNAPPTTIAATNGVDAPTVDAMPTAIGISATMVPTLVPIDSEITADAMNSPAKIVSDGTNPNVRVTMSSMLPISLAELAKAPARMNIHIMSSIFSEPPPRLNTLIRCFSVPLLTITATIAVNMNATEIGTL